MLTNAEYLEVDPVEFLVMRNVYIYYDEPILYSFFNKKKELYVCNLIKQTVNYQRWLSIRVNEEDLIEFENGVLSLLECINRSTYKECYVSDEYVDGSTMYYQVAKAGLSSKELPADDFYIVNRIK